MSTSVASAVRRIITVRASAISDFFDCAARAEAKHLLGKRCPTNGKALLGKAVHKSTAKYDEAVLKGTGITIDEAAAAAADAIHKPDEEVHFDEEEDPREIESIAIALHKRYCREIAPTQAYAAVEVTCERLEITDIGLALTGTADRIRRVESVITDPDEPPTTLHGVADLKSGKTAVRADGHVETKGHTYQIGVYELLAEKASGIPITAPGQIIGLQAGKTERGQRVATSQPIVGARDVLIGDREHPGVLESLAHMLHSGVFPGNPRSMMCHERYCPIYNTCKFRR